VSYLKEQDTFKGKDGEYGLLGMKNRLREKY